VSNVSPPIELTIPVRRTACWIALGYAGTAVLLIALERFYAGSEIAAVRRLTSLRRTDGLASWVVASLAVVVVLAAWMVFLSARRSGRRGTTGWAFVTAAAVAVAIDRGTRITVLLAVVEQTSFGKLPVRVWFLPWSLAGLLVFVFMWRKSRCGRGWLGVAAASFLASGILEFVFIDSDAAGSAAVLCVGAGLAATLIALLQELASDADPIEWSLSPAGRKRLLVRLSTIALTTFAVLFALDFFLNVGEPDASAVVRRYFNPASEASLASWVATTQTLLFALTLWLVFWTARIREPGRARGWFVLATGFTYLSLDDGAMVHERVATIVNATADAIAPAGLVERFPSYTWQFVFLPLLGMLAAFVVIFLWGTLRRPSLRASMLAGLMCLGLAVGLDYLEGLHRVEESEAYRHLSKVAEETIEMLGIFLLWISVLAHATAATPAMRLRFLRFHRSQTENPD